MSEIIKRKIIIGVDPGTQVLGYGILCIENKIVSLLQYGILRLSAYSDHIVKLKKINDRLGSILDEYCPDEMAIEAPFFGQNVQAMLKLGRAQGVAIGTALLRDIPVVEYAPKKIKQSVTGNGNASKEQVAAMIMRTFNLQETPEFLDATDAVGVALCHHYQQGIPQSKKTNWSNFIKDNPDRIK